MLYDTTHYTEETLANILAQCGFTSETPPLSPSWLFWKSEWRGRKRPIARYLSDFPHDEFFIAVVGNAFQVYEQDKQNLWFHMVAEIAGNLSTEELAEQIRKAIANLRES